MDYLIYLAIITFLCSVSFVLSVRFIARRRTRTTHDGLFVFWNGKQNKTVDPIHVLMALEAHPKFRLDLDPRRALEDGDREAMENLTEAVRQAFGVPAFTQPGRPGLTVYECCELLAVFIAYVDMQKKSTKPPQTSPPNTEPISTQSEKPITLDTLATG